MSENLIAALEAATHRVLDRLARDLSDLKLTQGEINSLAQLRKGKAITIAELQAATGQRNSTLTGVLDRLEKRGLIERVPNPKDRRSFRVAVTEEGAQAAKRVRRAFADIERQATKGLPPTTLDAVRTVLGRLE